MKYKSGIVSLMICSFAWSSAAFSPSLPLKGWNQGHIHVWTHQKRNGKEYRRETTSTHQDAFRLMNAYLDALGSAAADSAPGRPVGVRSFHPQQQQYQSKPIVGQEVIETTATVVSPTESPTVSVPQENVQNQYFPQPQYSMQQPPVPHQSQQQTRSPNSNAGVSPMPPLQQPQVDMQQPIPPNHEVGYFNQRQPTSSIPGSHLPPIPPNIPVPQPPELQPPPSAENFDPHNPNFGTGTQKAHVQPPPPQQPQMQQPQIQQPVQQIQQTNPQGTTSYYQPQQTVPQQPGTQAYQTYQQSQSQPQPQQTVPQQPGTQTYRTYQPQPTTAYPNGGNVEPQMQQQQQQQVPFNQVQTQTQVYNPSTGSFPQQDLPMQGPPTSSMNSQTIPQQQQQYGSFQQQNPDGTMTPQAPPNTQQTMAQQAPMPQQQAPPPGLQFDPHGLLDQPHPNVGGGSWYDVHMRKPDRKFDTVNPLERETPQPLPLWNQQPLAQSQQQQTPPPAQSHFDPHSPSWDRPMPGTSSAADVAPVPPGAVAGTTNLQGTSWHNNPNSWQGSQGLPYQDHPMTPLAAGMPVAAVAPPPLQPMKQSKRRPFDPHNPDWTRPLSSEIQGESRNTWQNHLGVPRVMVDLYSEGRPIDSEIELWQGPSNTPHKIKMYSEDGGIRPFKAVVETPGYGSSIDIKNSGPTAFPIQANVQPLLFRYEPERFKQVMGDNSLYTVSLNEYATSALVTLETDGMPLMAQVELWQGPDNTPQKVKVYNEQGLPFQLMVETPGSQCTIAVRNIGPMEFPLYCAVSASLD